MKIFLDTSALAKRYIEEPGSDELEHLLFSKMEVVSVSTLAFPEFAAAIGRKIRNKEIPRKWAARALEEFTKDWNGLFERIPFSENLAEEAASLAVAYPLKGADAVHLISAFSSGADLFVTSDEALIKAAEKISLPVYDPATGFYKP
jgi:predicted nucleic acid-binding protein